MMAMRLAHAMAMRAEARQMECKAVYINHISALGKPISAETEGDPRR